MIKRRKSLTLNAVLNVIKQCCMIIFPMITFPYASRVLGVDNYGKINFGTSIISYIGLIAALGINNYAIREGARIKDNTNKLRSFVNEVYTVNMISTVVAYIVLGVLVAFWPKLHDYRNIIWIQSLVVIFTTLGADWINIIYEDYLFITIRYIICQLIAVLMMLFFVKSQDDYVLYAFVSVLGTVLANIFNIVHIRKSLDIHLSLKISSQLKKHFIPILIIFGSSVATLIYINSDVTILGVLTNDATVGYYSVSVKIYSLIKQLMNAFLVVSIPRISKELAMEETGKVNSQLDSILSILLIIIGPVIVGLVMLSQNIIILFAGQEYVQGTQSLIILAIALGFATLACYYINVIMLPNRMEKEILIATIFSAIVNIVLNFILIPHYGASAAAFTTVISEMIMFLCGVWYTRRQKRHMRIKVAISCLFGTVWTTLICGVMQKLFIGDVKIILLSVVGSVLGVVLIIIILWYNEIRSMRSNILRN